MSRVAVVIGAGVSELVTAHYLARGGYRVIVVGGDAGAVPPAQPEWVPRQVVRDLGLEPLGFAVHDPDPWISIALAENNKRLELTRDIEGSAEAIAALDRGDAKKWPDFCARMARLAALLEAVYCASPLDPLAGSLGAAFQVAGAALRVRRLGREGMEDLFRLLPMSIADLLDEWFASDALKGALAAGGVMNLAQGPRSGGTAFNFLHHHVGSAAGVFRPSLTNIHEVLRKRPGVEMRTSALPGHIIVRQARAGGVALASGEEIPADLVVSGADPWRMLTEWIDPAWLDPGLVRAVRNVRSRGVAARVLLTLDSAVDLAPLVIAPSLEFLERAYDAWKYGEISDAPLIEARARMDAGRHVLDVQVQYVPYALDAAKGEAARSALADRVVASLSRHVAGLSERVVERRVLFPSDLEDLYGYPQGQPHHAELALDQVLWMRPVPQLARYRTPIEGLYLCGPAMHPGLAAAAGANAAREILRD